MDGETMATQIAVGDWLQRGVYRYTVSGLASADVSNAIDCGNFTDKSVQVDGTFQAALLTVQGRTATDMAWAGLTTPTGGAVEFTAAGIKGIEEVVRQVRFVNTTTVSTASDADNTNLKAVLFLRSDR
jgi:hypothetical protein